MTTNIAPIPVSVVIPCYRCGLTIDRAVESVLSQSARAHEIILVDDFSDDGTMEVLSAIEREFKGHVKTVAMGKNLGPASARNAGWAAATQPYIAFLDADDTWHADKLRLQFNFMQDNPSIVLSGHQCLWLKKGESPTKLTQSWSVTKINLRCLLFKNAFSTPTVMLARNLPFRFKEGRRYAEDFLLWLQICNAGFGVSRIEIPLAYVHKPFYGVSGLSSAMWSMELAELDNFKFLYRAGDIRLILYLAASSFSISKFFLRVLVLTLARIKAGF